MNENILSFLNAHGWDGAEVTPLAGDAGARQYFRMAKDARSAVLMSDEDFTDFVKVGQCLREAGVRVPDVMAEDAGHDFLLLEDFGDTGFADISPQAAYECAVDVLIHLRVSMKENSCGLPPYESGHVHQGRSKVVTWYMATIHGGQSDNALVQDYLSVWDEIEKNLPPCPQGFVHVDFHPGNLMWLEGVEGIARCGVLDFQGARWGPLPYDLGNLLEDARRDIAPDLKAAMMDRYCAGMNAEAQEIFMVWYRVVTTQFHCRVIGQFIELAVRGGKDNYLKHIPRVQKYLCDALADPILKPLQDWFVAQKIGFDEPVPSPEAAREIWNTSSHATGT